MWPHCVVCPARVAGGSCTFSEVFVTVPTVFVTVFVLPHPAATPAAASTTPSARRTDTHATYSMSYA